MALSGENANLEEIAGITTLTDIVPIVGWPFSNVNKARIRKNREAPNELFCWRGHEDWKKISRIAEKPPKGYFTDDLPPKILTSARRSEGHEYIRNIFLNKESGLKRPLGLWRLCIWEWIVISVSVSCFRPVCRFFFFCVGSCPSSKN